MGGHCKGVIFERRTTLLAVHTAELSALPPSWLFTVTGVCRIALVPVQGMKGLESLCGGSSCIRKLGNCSVINSAGLQCNAEYSHARLVSRSFMQHQFVKVLQVA